MCVLGQFGGAELGPPTYLWAISERELSILFEPLEFFSPLNYSLTTLISMI